jgi:hypothetical protein
VVDASREFAASTTKLCRGELSTSLIRLPHQTSAYQRGYESRAEVLVHEPTGWGGSSFGHAAIVVDGMAYSFGQDGMSIEPAADYMKRNSFRTTVGHEIALSTSQGAELKAFLRGFREDYSLMNFSTCVQPVVYALGMVGVNVNAPVLPISLGNALIDSGRLARTTVYPQTTPRTRPWYYPSNLPPWKR